MLVPYLVTVFAFGGNSLDTYNTVEVQPSMEICLGAKTIHESLPRQTSMFSGIHDISKPVLVDCKQIEVKVPTR